MDYDIPVTLRKREGLRDRFGQVRNDSWTDVATVRANRRLGTGSEAIRAGGDVSVAQASFRIRWMPGITAEMQLVEVAGGAVYEIKSVLADRRENRIDLVCEAFNPKT